MSLEVQNQCLWGIGACHEEIIKELEAKLANRENRIAELEKHISVTIKAQYEQIAKYRADDETLRRKMFDYERRIRQLEDEQAEYSETAMYARINELEAVVTQYEKQVTAIRAAVYREIEK